MANQEIHFKRQQLGQWRRKDADTRQHVNEEQMYRELNKLVGDGWRISLNESKADGRILGITAVR